MAAETHDTHDIRLSVVIPVKDDAAELRRCLRALSLQTRIPDEIVVVDNGSSDDSAAVAAHAGARVIACATPGIPAAAATGYDAASGSLVLRLDADCIPATTWVATMAGAAERHPGVSAFVGGARFIDGPRRLRGPLAAAYLGAYAVAVTPALGHLPLFGSNLAFRRDAWMQIRHRVHTDSDDLHDDLDLAFHLGETHRIVAVPRAAMGMSMRPFADRRAFARRIHRGFVTVLSHWPEDFPPVRWTRMAMRRAVVAARVRSAKER
ncbi:MULTISPECIES: glycosyltransferase family A protein [unclassified Microbacterium]|uniref:glycosyltransferase family A protein n=1 Tax=unclassified Microbacterium TaxID=2609290 RepID=UPI0038694E31